MSTQETSPIVTPVATPAVTKDPAVVRAELIAMDQKIESELIGPILKGQSAYVALEFQKLIRSMHAKLNEAVIDGFDGRHFVKALRVKYGLEAPTL